MVMPVSRQDSWLSSAIPDGCLSAQNLMGCGVCAADLTMPIDHAEHL